VLYIPGIHRVLSRDLLGEPPPRYPIHRSLGNFGICGMRRHAEIIAGASAESSGTATSVIDVLKRRGFQVQMIQTGEERDQAALGRGDEVNDDDGGSSK
jgi:hypothetical protein